MNAKKIIAILAVLAMATVPFLAIAEDNDSEGATPEIVSIDNLGNNYWVKSNISSGVATLSINDSKDTKCYVIVDNTTTISTVKFDGNFTIPVNCGIGIVSGINVMLKNQTLTVEGTLTMNVVTEKSVMSYDDTSSVGAVAASALDEFTYNFSLDNAKVEVNGGYFAPITTYFDDDSCSVTVNKAGKIGIMNVKGSSTDPLMSMYNVTTGGSDQTNFTVSVGNNGKTVILSGIVVGTEDNSNISFNNNSLNELKNLNATSGTGAILRNVDLYNLNVLMNNVYGSIVIENDNKTLNLLDHNVVFIVNGSYYLQNAIKSGSGKIMIVTLYSYANSPEAYIKNRTANVSTNIGFDYGGTTSVLAQHRSTYLFCGEYDENGYVASYAYVKLDGKEGINSIKSGSEYGDTSLFMMVGTPYDLTTVDVDCKSGYSFDGWYYLNEDGTESKILNPENFIVDESMIIYAKTVPCEQDYGGFFIGIIAVLVILGIVAFAYVILRDHGIIRTY